MKIDDYGDENDQKQTNTMPFKSKYTPFRHNYLVKKRTKSTNNFFYGCHPLTLSPQFDLDNLHRQPAFVLRNAQPNSFAARMGYARQI